MILPFVLKFWNLTCWYLRHYSNILRAPPSWMDIGTGSYPPFSKMAAKIWNSHKATQIICHYWQKHGMWPIISRYFIPMKRIEMIEMLFGAPYSLWGPPQIQDGRQNRISDTSFELLLFVYNIMAYDISLSGCFIFKIINWQFFGYFSHLWIPRTIPKSKMAARIRELNKVAKLLLIFDETMACDLSFHVIFFQIRESK